MQIGEKNRGSRLLAGLKPQISSQFLSRLSTHLVLLILCAIGAGLLVGFVEMRWASHRIKREIDEQRAINVETQAHVAALEGEAQYRESDVYAEQAAREQLGMAREGETVLMPRIVSQAPPAPSPAPAPSTRPAASIAENSTTPNHERWWRAFFPPN